MFDTQPLLHAFQRHNVLIIVHNHGFIECRHDAHSMSVNMAIHLHISIINLQSHPFIAIWQLKDRSFPNLVS
jgi:hypothetical protein